MAGGSSRRHIGLRARPPQADEPSSPQEAAPASLSIREAAVGEEPSKKTCDASRSTSSSSSGCRVWEYLLENMLQQIIALISSFHDLLAFRGTCRSWRAASSSFPSVYTFTFPPLHLEPDIRRDFFNYKPNMRLVDPAQRALSLRVSAPLINPRFMHYLGCSYGYLIFSDGDHCHLRDVYTGTKVKPPKLPSNGGYSIYYGLLVAPLTSPNSHLTLLSKTSIFQWQVGANSWTEQPLVGEAILQIVFFKGQMFAMDFVQRLHTISIEPQLSIQEVAIVWEEGMLVRVHTKPWLVVCGDMLLLVDFSVSMGLLFGLPGTFRVFRLDFSDEPAKWVKMEKLDNWALFLPMIGGPPHLLA
uniref:Uncharacterized protein n=1 Tax=Avena sativa TaxID=4498 RepID=A0ACD5W7E4_AVESA